MTPRTNRKRPRRPPYGSTTAARISAGDHPMDALILAGPEAWDLARLIGAADARSVAILVLPPGEDPETFDWGFLRGLGCRIWPTEPEKKDRLHRLSILLVKAGSPLVQRMYADGSDCDIYRPAPRGAGAGHGG